MMSCLKFYNIIPNNTQLIPSIQEQHQYHHKNIIKTLLFNSTAPTSLSTTTSMPSRIHSSSKGYTLAASSSTYKP